MPRRGFEAKGGTGVVKDKNRPRSEAHDDKTISEARERVRQMEQDVERNKSLIARTRALIQRLTELLGGKSSA